MQTHLAQTVLVPALLGLLLLTGLSRCAPARYVSPEVIPTKALPPGVRPDEVYVDTDGLQTARRMMQRLPNGTAASIRGTYAEQVANDSSSSFRVEAGHPFIGQFWLLNAYQGVAHDFAITCLIDYVQTPCAVDQPFVQIESLAPMAELLLPLEIPVQGEGLHDLSVLFAIDPFPDRDDPEAYDRFRNIDDVRINLYVNGIAAAPIPIVEVPPGQLDAFNGGFVASPLAQPIDETSKRITWWTRTTVPAGELFDFYIHLNNQGIRAFDDAMMAFIDYEQVPIYRQGQPQIPFYVRSRNGVWQPVAVQVRAPTEPGIYEFMVVGMTEPFSRLEINGEYVGTQSVHSSVRIRLEVQ
jgi:hypothetical protein